MKSTILVIEDERTTRHSITQFLESENFEVLAAENGRMGIAMAKGHLPDLIICDIMMPEMDGYDVLIELQSSTDTAVIPFVFLTATSEKEGLRHGMEMGADDYLSKPISGATLLNAINSRLKKHQTQEKQYQNSSQYSDEASVLKRENNSLKDFAALKGQLLDRLLEGLKETLPELYMSLMQQSREGNWLQGEDSLKYSRTLASAIALMNETYEFNRTLTPENASKLKSFPFAQPSTTTTESQEAPMVLDPSAIIARR